MMTPFDWFDGDAAVHYRQFLDSIRNELLQRELELVVIPLNEADFDQDSDAICRYLEGSNPAGLIISRSKPKDELIDYLQSHNRKFVVFGSPSVEAGLVNSVDTDNYSAFYDLSRHVLSLGHQHIAFLNGDQNFSYARLRERAFRDAARDNGTLTREDWFLHGKPTRSVGSLMAAELLKSKQIPTALICATDELAEGAIDTCRSVGLLVGQDISITGYGGAIGHLSNLTTSAFDSQRIAREIARLIADQIWMVQTEPQRIRIPCTLVEGSTCGPVENSERIQSTLLVNARAHLAGHTTIDNYVRTLSHYERAQHQSASGSWIYNVQKDLFNLSPEACELLGQSFKPQFKLAEILEHIHTPDVSQFLKSWERGAAGRDFCVTNLVIKANEKRKVEWRGDFVVGNSGELICAEGSIRDVTLQAQYAEQITAILQSKEEVHDQGMMALAEVSHEIRTPLNAMIAQINKLDTLVSEQQSRDAIVELKGSAQLLRSTLDAAIDFVRLRHTEVNHEVDRFNLRAVFDEVVTLFGAVAGNNGTSLILVQSDVLDQPILGDRQTITQILNNLVSNAIKFTKQGSVHLEAQQSNENAGQIDVELSVSDNGIGMTESQVGMLFKPFEQTDPSIAGRFGGSGLGLSLCQQLAKRLGSEISVTSQLDKGSRFAFGVSFALAAKTPVLKEEAETQIAAQPNPAPAAFSGKQVLIADDSPLNLRILEDQLNELGVSVTCADDGAAALECLRYKRFDLVVLDREMPRLDGFETCRQYRAVAESMQQPRVPIILASASTATELREPALKAGFDDVIEKQFDSEELTEILSKWLQPAS